MTSNSKKLLSLFSMVISIALSITLCIAEPISKTYDRYLDFDLDGHPEKVSIAVEGESIKDPFRWTLTVTSKGKPFFTHKCDDSWLDSFFHDPEYYNPPNGTYSEQKQEYYFHDLAKRVFPNQEFNRNPLSESDIKRVSYHLTQELKSEHRIEGTQAKAIIDSAIKRLNQNAPILVLFCNPLCCEGAYVFLPEINTFIEYDRS